MLNTLVARHALLWYHYQDLLMYSTFGFPGVEEFILEDKILISINSGAPSSTTTTHISLPGAHEQGTPRDADPGGEQNQVWGLKLEQTVWTSARPTPISPLVRADSVETSNTRLSGARVDSVEDPTNTSLTVVHPTK